MYIRLKNHFKLREDRDTGLLFDTRVENILSKINRIPKIHLGILRLANGYFSKNDLIQLYKEVSETDDTKATSFIENILQKYEDYLEVIPDQIPREDLFISSKLPCEARKVESFHRLDAPLLVSLVLTYKCMCKCKYCFVEASEDKNISHLETSVILKVIHEAKSIGVSTLHITGGEPFLKSDIYEIIQTALAEGLVVNISTKKIFDETEARQLKSTGLKSIQVSLDAAEDNLTEYLTGVRNFSTKMLNSIKLLIEFGIDVAVNTVVTKVNGHSIEALIGKLSELGVQRHYISPYLRTLGRHDDDLFPDKEIHDNIRRVVNGYIGEMEINYKEPDYSTQESREIDNIHRCSGGRMGLVILPEGKVTICERLTDDDEFIIGDIKTQPLEKIWNSEKLYKLIQPKKELFRGTDCYECSSFKDCVLDKGLCYARVKTALGKTYDKDPLCPKNNQNFRFV